MGEDVVNQAVEGEVLLVEEIQVVEKAVEVEEGLDLLVEEELAVILTEEEVVAGADLEAVVAAEEEETLIWEPCK